MKVDLLGGEAEYRGHEAARDVYSHDALVADLPTQHGEARQALAHRLRPTRRENSRLQCQWGRYWDVLTGSQVPPKSVVPFVARII